MYRTRIALTALLSALALLAAACSGDDATAPGDDTPAADDSDGVDYSAADLTFLQGMIPHHAEAVEMARLVPDRTDRPELNQLAEGIIASQEAEISQMDGMLAEAGVERDDSAGNGGDGMDGMQGMEGMQGEEEVARLASLEGVEFDLAFTE
jgi:hypothetical protein